MRTTWRRWHVVDEVRVVRLLRHADELLGTLRAEQSAPAGRRADPLWLAGVKYLLISCIECCIDIAQHACSADRLGLPKDNADALRLLGARGYLHPETAASLARAVGFRNVLEHEYIDGDYAIGADNDIVLAQLQDLSDLQAFIAEASGWLRDEVPGQPGGAAGD